MLFPHHRKKTLFLVSSFFFFSSVLTDQHACLVESDSVTPQSIACQALLSMGFSRQEYWSGLPFPLPGDLPDPGIEPVSYTAGRFFTTAPPGKLTWALTCVLKLAQFGHLCCQVLPWLNSIIIPLMGVNLTVLDIFNPTASGMKPGTERKLIK